MNTFDAWSSQKNQDKFNNALLKKKKSLRTNQSGQMWMCLSRQCCKLYENQITNTRIWTGRTTCNLMDIESSNIRWKIIKWEISHIDLVWPKTICDVMHQIDMQNRKLDIDQWKYWKKTTHETQTGWMNEWMKIIKSVMCVYVCEWRYEFGVDFRACNEFRLF